MQHHWSLLPPKPTWLFQQEGHLLFVSYIRALCIQSGYKVVQDQVNQLLEPRQKKSKKWATSHHPSISPSLAGQSSTRHISSQSGLFQEPVQVRCHNILATQSPHQLAPPYIPGTLSAFLNSKQPPPTQQLVFSKSSYHIWQPSLSSPLVPTLGQ